MSKDLTIPSEVEGPHPNDEQPEPTEENPKPTDEQPADDENTMKEVPSDADNN